MTVTLDPTATRLTVFEIDTTVTGYNDDAEETISTNRVHIHWRGAPLPLTPHGLYELTYWAKLPITDAVVELTDDYSSNHDPCLLSVAQNLGVEDGAGVVVGLAR
jgi:hypothetical protein